MMRRPAVARPNRGPPKDDRAKGHSEVTPTPPRPGSPSEADRMRIFAALVETRQDGAPSPDERLRIAHRFGVSAYTLAAIEREGTALHWPAVNG
jgi:hypothetical protein